MGEVKLIYTSWSCVLFFRKLIFMLMCSSARDRKMSAKTYRVLGCIFLFQEYPFLGPCFSFLPGFLRILFFSEEFFYRNLLLAGLRNPELLLNLRNTPEFLEESGLGAALAICLKIKISHIFSYQKSLGPVRPRCGPERPRCELVYP